MHIWEKIQQWLQGGRKVILMYVVDSQGSSPGRTGFKMIVNDQGEMHGSIGGGFMEHKLVELCKKELLRKGFEPFIRRQIHRPDLPQDRSGMICSGEQTIAFYPLVETHIPWIHELLEANGKGVLIADNQGICFQVAESISQKFESKIISPTVWQLTENLHFQPVLHIIGGGHVGLALSKFACELDFRVKIYDDREGLNTMVENHYAERVMISDYAQIADILEEGADQYVVLMSFGYRTDQVILRELLGYDFAYLGMMGSQAKVDTLFEELREEGISQDLLERVHAPVGVQIRSKTPAEIAVSILAEVIGVRNGQMRK